MSNQERDPREIALDADSRVPRVVVLEPREVPLGGPRAMPVRRTLPQRSRSLVGAWCFIDSYGPTIDAMDVPPHPHTGLQTVSWLYAGDIEHRDSVGSVARIVPGQVNLMTAGAGIQHSEVSQPSGEIRGVQLWVALPDRSRNVGPAFEHHSPRPFALGDAALRVFVGELAGSRSPVTTYSPLVGAQLDLPAGGRVEIPVDPAFEHGLVVDSGSPILEGVEVPTDHLGVLAAGTARMTVEAGAEPVRALLIGGEPLGEQIVMWWNFVGRSHDEIVRYRDAWQRDVIAGGSATGRFGAVSGYPGSALAAPELPNARLRPRD